MIPLVDKFEAQYDFVANDGKSVYWLTNRDAPNYRMIKMDLDNPSEDNWIDIIPQHEKNVLKYLECVDEDKLIAVYMQDVCDIIQIRELHTGKLIFSPEIPIGTISSVSGKRKHSEVFFYFYNYLNPGIIYRIDVANDTTISVRYRKKHEIFQINEYYF